MCFPNQTATAAHKLCARSSACVLLSYPTDHRGYRCFDLNTRLVITSRHVVFDESVFPFRAPSSATMSLARALLAAIDDDPLILSDIAPKHRRVAAPSPSASPGIPSPVVMPTPILTPATMAMPMPSPDVPAPSSNPHASPAPTQASPMPTHATPTPPLSIPWSLVRAPTCSNPTPAMPWLHRPHPPPSLLFYHQLRHHCAIQTGCKPWMLSSRPYRRTTPGVLSISQPTPT